MPKRSLFYKNSWIYINFLKIIHGKNFIKRYKYMSAQIGRNVSVFEPGAGPGVIPPFIDKTSTYQGFDINRDFVNSARGRGINIRRGNILDSDSYIENDVTVLVDVIHHLKPENQKILLTNVFTTTKKRIIICEPYSHEFSFFKKIPFARSLHKKGFEFIEQDGNNEARLEHVHSLEDLKQTMLNGFGIIPPHFKKEIKQIGEDLIVTYHIQQKPNIIPIPGQIPQMSV